MDTVHLLLVSQSVKVSSHLQSQNSPSQGPQSDLVKVTAAQLAILTTEVTEDNFDRTVCQIDTIIKSAPTEIHVKYLKRLLLHQSDLIPTNVVVNPQLPKLIQHELKALVIDVSRISVFQQVITDADSELLKFFTLDQLFARYSLSAIERILLTLSVSTEPEQAKTVITKAFPDLLNAIKNAEITIEQLFLLFEQLIYTDSASVLDKARLFSVVCEASEITKIGSTTLHKLHGYLLKMPFRDILQALGPENISPERLITDLLSIQAPEELTDSLALLLAEIISPCSQNLTGTNQRTALTPVSIPEASAKGSQFGSVIRKLPHQSWPTVFESMNQRLTRPDMTEASLSELLSALDDQTIDEFIGFDWSLDFKITLFVTLRRLSPQRGSFDLLRTNYLKPIINDASLPNIKNTVLFFKNVTHLELFCISMSTAIENAEYKRFLHQIFEDDIKTAPELIALGCVHFTPQSAIVDDLLENLMVHLLDDSSAYYPFILKDLKDKELLFKICSKLVNNRPSPALNKTLLAFLSQMGYIVELLDSLPLRSALEVAASAVSVGWYNGFEKFLDAKKGLNGFAEVLNSFILSQVDSKRESRGISVRAMYICLKSLPRLPLAQQEHFNDTKAQVLQAYPRLINFGGPHDDAILVNGDTNSFSFDVEQQMKVLYQRMYNHEIEIKDVISTLQQLRDSDVPSDQDLFACMIHSLLDEYKFFPEYPLNALALTSVLFGSMIHFDLMRGTALDVGLHFIFKACQQPPESNMFKFAVQALFAFRTRFVEFSEYCQLLTRIDSLKSQPQVYQLLFTATSGENAVDTVKFKSVNDNATITNDVPQEVPPQSVSSKILFIMNNLSEDNLLSKIDDLKKVLTRSFYRWLAEYIVANRAKTEPNNHHLYYQLVQRIGDELLFDYMVFVSVHHVKILLETSDNSQVERSQLKNLGSWLGMMTLARNRPLKYTSVALKELLVEASDRSKLAMVIPFVCKVIDQTKSSEVFKLPNPWTLGVLKVLAELYEFSELKLNLRFEFEVLCSSLGIELSSIEPSALVRKHDPQTLLRTGVASLSLESKNIPLDQAQILAHQQSLQQHPSIQQQQLLQQQQQQQHQQQPQQHQQLPQHQSIGIPPHNSAPMAQLPQINEAALQNLVGSTVFVTNAALKRVFTNALIKSIRDILPPAVERAVSIAVTTARALVLKDFATEVDELKLRAAAVNVVRQLAESLALATCRDPLKESVQSAVHAFAAGQLVPLDELPQAIGDNIDIACSIIQKAAMDKATLEIEEILVSSVAVRRHHKERRQDQPFYSQHLSRYAVNLPEPLGLRPTGVTPQQLHVYENFGKNITASPGMAVPTPHAQQHLQQPHSASQSDAHVSAMSTPTAASAVPLAPVAMPPVSSELVVPPTGLNIAGAAPNNGTPVIPATIVPSTQSIPVVSPAIGQQVSPEQMFQYLQNCIENLARATAESSITSLQDIGPDSTIRTLLGQIFAVMSRNLNKDALLMKVTQYILNTLVSSSESTLTVDVFVLLLEKLCAISATTRRDVVWWMKHINDDRRFNQRILMSMFTVDLITPAQLDAALARYVSPTTLEFTVGLIRESLRNTGFAAFICDFCATLSKLRDFTNQSEVVDQFIGSVDNLEIGLLKGTALDADSASESGIMSYLFMEWIRLLQNTNSTDAMYTAFVVQLIQHGVLDTFDNTTLFLRCAVGVAVDYFKESDPANDGFLACDSLSKLLVRVVAAQDQIDSREKTITLALSVISLVFAEDHASSRENFNERPYFRVFSSLLSEWNSVDSLKDDTQLSKHLYMTLAKFLNTFQPIAFPGFAFAWITLISHRFFLPKVLALGDANAEAKFVLLLLALLRFQAKHITTKQIPEVFTVIYKGTLRVFLLLLHDYPEILVKYHYQLCCEIPPSFIQLKNIVLSAFPKSVAMPDPFTQGLKVGRLPEVAEAPNVGYHPGLDLQNKKSVDGYLRIPSNQHLKTIFNNLKQQPVDEAGIGYNKTQYNVRMINALVLYVGMEAVEDTPNRFNPKSSHFSLLSGLMQEGDVEFQYQLIGAICNQLRYPNSHTHWFSHLMLHFFGNQTLWNGKRVQVQHVITRVLLERVICNRPHPWGLLITFVELLKNANLAFFDLPFVKEDPEMARLFGTLQRHFGITAANGTRDASAAPVA